MNDSWIREAGRLRLQPVTEGFRPSGEHLLAMIDQADPALMEIASALQEMRNAGIELDDNSVRMAIQIGRHRHQQGPGAANSPEVPESRPTDTGSIVYYVRRAQLVKIGTTRRPRDRFEALLPDEILAWEPGSYETEKARHAQFAADRQGRSEFFILTERIAAVARQLRELHGEPDPTWLTISTVDRVGQRDLRKALQPASSPRMVTVQEAVLELGVRRSTIYGWIHRKRLPLAGRNERGRPIYLVDHMVQLASRSGLIADCA